MDEDDTQSGEPTSSAAAHAAAARADTSDVATAVEGEGEPTEVAQQDGTSPDPASQADASADDGSSPDPDAAAADPNADSDEWTEEERKLREQYKSERELVRALKATKDHSLKQHTKLKELEGQLTGRPGADATDGDGRDLPADRSTGTPSTAATDSLPNTPEILEARRSMAAAADEYDAKLKVIKDTNTEIGTLTRTLTKLEGIIEDTEKALTDPELDQYGKDRLTDKLVRLRGDERNTKSDITRLGLERTQANLEAGQLHRDYHGTKNELKRVAQEHRAAAEARTREQREFNDRKATEKKAITAALDRVVTNHKVPEKARAAFKEQLLADADRHSQANGRIQDLDAFLEKRAAWHKQHVEAWRADADTTYAERKRQDAATPAPSGKDAVARPSSRDAPLSSKDAHRNAVKNSRIPIGG